MCQWHAVPKEVVHVIRMNNNITGLKCVMDLSLKAALWAELRCLFVCMCVCDNLNCAWEVWIKEMRLKSHCASSRRIQ